MTRVHDMGGRFGDGAITPDSDTPPVFDHDWHARALALTLASGGLGLWNIDVSRHARECLPPKDYANFTYYEKWLAALTNLLVDTGAITREELSGAAPAAASLADKALTADRVAAVLAAGGPANRDTGPAPLFTVGDTVTTRRITGNRLVDGGHTRLPAYAAGATGNIVICHGNHVLPDSSAHRLGDAPEPLYAVAFKACELWTNPENPEDEVVLDLWQSYLEPA